MTFPVFDLWLLTRWINCSFYHLSKNIFHITSISANAFRPCDAA